MKLTNQMRADFVNDVMKNVKWKSPWTSQTMVTEIEKRLRDAQPKEVIDK